MMKLAARLQFRQCRKVLITDLTWPSYERLLLNEQARTNNQIHKAHILRRLLDQKCSMEELIVLLATEYEVNGCDGLFLPIVDSRGIRLPIGEITKRIKERAEIRFCVLDAAQAFQHVPLDLDQSCCDFAVAGCHKWLGSGTPMGLGFYGRQLSRKFIDESVDRWLRDETIDDPMLSYVQELTGGPANPFGETAAIVPLLTANGAVVDAEEPPDRTIQSSNRQQVMDCVADSCWRLVRPDEAFKSQILLLRRPHGAWIAKTPNQVRHHFLENRVAVTAYDKALVRLAIPATPLPKNSLAWLRQALA